MKKINLYTTTAYFQSKKKLSRQLIRWSVIVTTVSFFLVFVILAWEWQTTNNYDQKSIQVRALRSSVKGDENIEKKYNQLSSLYNYYVSISQNAYPWAHSLNSLLFFSADAKVESISLDATSVFHVKLTSDSQENLKKLSDRLEILGGENDGVKRLVLTEGKISEATGGAVLTVRGLLKKNQP